MAKTPRCILLFLTTMFIMALGTGAQDKGPVAKEADSRIDIQITDIQVRPVSMPASLSTLGIPRPAAAMPWFQIAIEYRMAGGGTKAGHIHGETDDYSYNVIKDPVSVNDLNATILHCMGIDHERFTYKFQGLDARLSGVEAPRIVPELLA